MVWIIALTSTRTIKKDIGNTPVMTLSVGTMTCMDRFYCRDRQGWPNFVHSRDYMLGIKVFTQQLCDVAWPSVFKPTFVENYDGKIDPAEWLSIYE